MHTDDTGRAWLRWRIWVPAVGAALLVIASLVILATLTSAAEQRAQEALKWERHSYAVMMASQDVLSALKDAEIGQRGYLLLGDEAYLEPYSSGKRRVAAAIGGLRRLTADNLVQQQALDVLSDTAARRVNLLDIGIALRRQGRDAGVVDAAREAQGRAIMDEARATLAQIRNLETALLDRRAAATMEAARDLRVYHRVFLVLVGVALIGLVGAMVWALYRRAQARLDAVRARAADDARDAADFLNLIADAGPDAIYAKDRDGVFVMVNRRSTEILGAPREEILGRRDADFLLPEHAAPIEAVDRRIIETGEAVVVDETVTEGGAVTIFQSAKMPWRRGDEIVGLIGVSRDVTQERAAETMLRDINSELERRVEERTREVEAAQAQARQMQKMEAIGQLTGGIAHDFNNMLAIVIGSLDLAKRRLDTDRARALTYIANAEEGAKRAAVLTARLLAFSRQQPLAPAPLDPNKLVAGMSEMLRRTIGEHLRIETVLAGGVWRTFADAGQLENAILNLCVNARDAMPDGGHLTIETANGHLDDEYAAVNAEAAAGQYVLICVTDTGEGMSPDVIERAFDPFYTTKGVGKGTGLGLSQVYGFVKQSGGHVKIYSEPGHGTTVKIYLPRHHGHEAAPRDAVRPERPMGRPGETVLVTEDDPSVRSMSVDALRELGYTVIEAENGADALQKLQEQPQITLLFTDIVMPDMNGRQLADRALARLPALRVLYTTGYTRNAVVHNGVIDPGTAFLPKPFTVDALARKIRDVLDAKA